MGIFFGLFRNAREIKRRPNMIDQGQEIADAQTRFENSKASRLIAKHRWEANKGRYHCELVARREAGETMTVADMKALEALAIDNIEYVKAAYLAFINADSDYRVAKVDYEKATRNYWDSKPLKF